MKQKLLIFLLLLTVFATSAEALKNLGLDSAGAATASSLESVIYNPAALKLIKQRVISGGYFFNGEDNVIALGYLEPGVSEFYNPKISNFRLAGGLTWLRVTEGNHYYYTVTICTEPVYGGVNLIYKKTDTGQSSFGMDVALGTEWFSRLTTALVVTDLMNWTTKSEASFSSSPTMRLAMTYKFSDSFLSNFDAFTKKESNSKINLSLSGEYILKRISFRGGCGFLLEPKSKQVTFVPSLGASYKANESDSKQFSIDLGISYKQGKIGHSAGFNYSF